MAEQRAHSEHSEPDPAAAPRHAARLERSGLRPRHGTAAGDRLGRVVAWTTLGTLIPGAGLIAGGRKVAGGIVLTLFLLALAGLAAFALLGDPMALGVRLLNARTLTILAAALIAAFVVWAAIILGSYGSLRRGAGFGAAQSVVGGVLVASLLAIVAVPTGGGAYYSLAARSTLVTVFDNGKPDKPALKTTDPWADKPRVNVFLIGRDDGPDRTGVRPDTMLVASIDTRSGKADLISVPRNLAYARFPEGTPLAEHFPDGFNAFGSTESLINAVWTWAEANPRVVDAPRGAEVGLYATMEAVSGSLGVDIDYWAAVNMAGFEDLINAIGGVNIDVERKIPMGGGTNLATGGKNVVFGYIEPGQQRLGGQKALWYARSREGADNYDRMCRQQRLIKTVLGQVKPATLALKFPQLASSASRNVETDIQQQDLSAFVEMTQKVQKAGVHTVQITNDVVQTWNPDYEILHRYIANAIDPASVPKPPKQSGPPGTTPLVAPSKTSKPKPTSSATRTLRPGQESADGKCYPQGYDPQTASRDAAAD